MMDATQAGLLFAQLFDWRLPESAHEVRAVFERFSELVNAGLPEVGAFHEAVPVAPGVSADVVVPAGKDPHPVLVYLHGGGWICGSPATHRKLACRFAEAGYLVVNVDYRLAPEHPFPAPFEDCLAAIRWAAREAPRFGGDPDRLAVGGDSAGANLAATAAAALAGSPVAVRALLLLYGVYDFATLREETAAVTACDALAVLSGRLIDIMVGAYLGAEPAPGLIDDPRVSPLRVAHALPPCHVVVGAADPLIGQAEQLARALDQARVPFEHRVDADMPHCYAQMEFLPAARSAIERMVAFLGKHV